MRKSTLTYPQAVMLVMDFEKKCADSMISAINTCNNESEILALINTKEYEQMCAMRLQNFKALFYRKFEKLIIAK